jgi:small subunit ribosomal protein S6
MFLVDSALAASDWEGTLELIKNILEKSDAEVVSLKKWDERKLAYEINKKSRGTYILCYFNAPGDKIRDIERSVKISEKIMRVLILNTEPMSQEDIDRETPLMAAERKAAEAAAAAEQALAEQEESTKAAEEPAAEASTSPEIDEKDNVVEDIAEDVDDSVISEVEEAQEKD